MGDRLAVLGQQLFFEPLVARVELFEDGAERFHALRIPFLAQLLRERSNLFSNHLKRRQCLSLSHGVDEPLHLSTALDRFRVEVSRAEPIQEQRRMFCKRLSYPIAIVVQGGGPFFALATVASTTTATLILLARHSSQTSAVIDVCALRYEAVQ